MVGMADTLKKRAWATDALSNTCIRLRRRVWAVSGADPMLRLDPSYVKVAGRVSLMDLGAE